jgi:hypothetical protein
MVRVDSTDRAATAGTVGSDQSGDDSGEPAADARDPMPGRTYSADELFKISTGLSGSHSVEVRNGGV